MEEYSLEGVLRRHLVQYTGMGVEDCVQLLYQMEWGPGHFIGDAEAFCEKFVMEMNLPFLLTAQPYGPEPIGNGLARVYLSALDAGPSPQTFTNLSVRASKLAAGSAEGLLEKLGWLRKFGEAGNLPWPQAETDAFLDKYIEAGCHRPHHSARYVQLYNPHYRLLDTWAAACLAVFEAADRALRQKPHVLLGIDGMCAAGKSALAQMLAQVYHCGVVHADDFFLPQALRGAARLAQPGGNLHYERLAPVARQAAEAKAFSYEAYDCRANRITGVKNVPEASLTVLEGSYTLHPAVGAPCDVRVFLSVDAAEQVCRIEQREGEGARRFFEKWIPMENRYFGEYGVRESCDVVLDTTHAAPQCLPGSEA